MIPYLSYWSKGYKKQPSETVLLMHKIAAYFAKKHYGACYLVTDSEGSSLFQDCGFTEVQILKELDSVPSEYSATWSLGKILCFKHLAENNIHFLHLDYDVFLFQKLPYFIQDADIFVQSIEHDATHFYGIDYMLNNCKYKTTLENNISNHSYNMGIFGGKNSSFIKNYCDFSLDIVFHPLNKDFFIDGGIGHWQRAAIAEQWLLACWEQKKQNVVTTLFDRNRMQTNAVPLEEDCIKYGYTHIWGAKNSSFWDQQIAFLAKILNLT
jgi:hypothetical protein